METLTDFNQLQRGRSLWQDAFTRLSKNRLAVFGLIVLICMMIIAIFAGWISPYSYETQDLDLSASPPSSKHWLGTDTLGRDLFTRILYGSRVSLMVGFLATAVALTIGVLWGTISGYMGGRVDIFMMRIVAAEVVSHPGARPETSLRKLVESRLG